MSDEIVKVSGLSGEAEISLFGGHLLRYQRADEPPILWLSKSAVFDQKTPIRGGVPIIWPWFGGHPTDSSKPSHGFARRHRWQLESKVQTTAGEQVILSLSPTSGINALWPHSFRLQLDLTIGDALTIRLRSENRGTEPYRYGVALHTYFHVGDITQTAVSGLNGVTYINQLDNNRRYVQEGDITFAAETDNIFVHTTHPIVIKDSAHRRNIVIETAGCQSAVVWNPWIDKAKRMADFDDEAYRQMVCVESGNVADNVQHLEPGEAHTITAVIRSESSQS